MKKTALIVEGFGHGFISVLIAKVYNLTPVAFSTKETKEEFEKEVELIYRNLGFVAPTLRKATWEERDELLATGWNIRQSLLNGEITAEMWRFIACSDTWLPAADKEGLPTFAGLPKGPILFVPQKLQSDGMCGVSAAQQSLSPSFFSFLKGSGYDFVLGQHFFKVNDLEKVQSLAKEFYLYVPGMTEDVEVLGIRGVQHERYWNLYRKLHGSVGIAGTHTWYLLTCRPEVPQIILYNKKGVENWEEISAAYREARYPIFSFGFDENTDLNELMEEVEECFDLYF